MRLFRHFDRLKEGVVRGRYLLLSAALIAVTIVPSLNASAAPTFSNFPISATYKDPGEMTIAGGAMWYLESSSSATSSDYIGKMTTAGTATNYSIGYPSGQTSFRVGHITTGPDGNVWFDGDVSGAVYSGYLNVSTGAVTFFSSFTPSYSAGPIATGSDGKVYFSTKSAGAPANTYLLSIDPATSTISTVYTYDTYTNIEGITNGPDGRLWLTDSYYGRVYARSLSGGTNDTYTISGPSKIISGSDGNLWLKTSGNFTKMTTSGAITNYSTPSGAVVGGLVSGPDGAVWFTDMNVAAPKIGRIATGTGAITQYTIPGTSVNYEVGGPVLGPDGAIWFGYSDSAGFKLGKVTTAPTFSNFPLTATYKDPREMTIAGGAVWYLESSSSAAASDHIGKMTTSGTTTDYNIGYPSGKTSFRVAHITTGPDGNVWFDGDTSGAVYTGFLNITTGTVTFYTSYSPSYAAGPIAAGSDGKVYFTAKSSGSPANTYLRSMDPATGTISSVNTYDTYTNIVGMTSGPDGRLWLIDSEYNRVYARSLSGGTSDTYYIASGSPSKITSGPDGNLWIRKTGNFTKMTTSGTATNYAALSGIPVGGLVTGSDNAVWFTDMAVSTPKIGRVTTTGAVTEYTIPGTSVYYELGGPVLGPDGAIWFGYSDSTGYKLGRLGY